MITDVGDFDRDGQPGWFVSSINSNRLYRNMSRAMFHMPEANAEARSWGWGSCFADFDLDGHLDIDQTNGWVNNTGSLPS